MASGSPLGVPLKVLLVEDSPDDAELVLQELRRGGYEPSHSRVETMDGLLAALAGERWTLVIADYSIPGFSGLKALEVVRDRDPDLPFILVSGTIGEELAVEAMKAGAHDYVMKGNLARLPVAVERELREAAVRRERRRAERPLRDGEARYRTPVEISPDAIFVHRGDRIVFVNSACVRLFGASSPEGLLGRTTLELYHPDFHAVIKERIRSMLESGERAPTIEGQIIRQDGKVVDVEATAAPSSYNGATAVKVILRDISERKQAERELRDALRKAEESDRLKSAFLNNMSHEIRTPLSVITGFATILVDELSPRAKQKHLKILEAIERGSRRLISTVQAILDVAKIETGSFGVSPTEVAVEPLLRRAVEEVRKFAEEKNLALSCEMEERAAVVRFDEYCLSRAVASLLDNAVKFADKGEIAVRLFRDAEGTLSVEIRDTGVGIDPAYVPRMFQLFSQEDVGDTRRFEGPGLGLRLAWHYLDLNGARLEAESKKGEGSVFRIRFPREIEKQETFRGNRAAAERGSEPRFNSLPLLPGKTREKKRIVLVVEDDPSSQMLMTRILSNRYEVLLAESAEEARKHIQAHGAAIDAVLMDISLKGSEDGLSLTRDLRRDVITERTPVIATTAHALQDYRRRALEAGCNAYLAKPFDREELLTLLEASWSSPLSAGNSGRNVGGRLRRAPSGSPRAASSRIA